MSCTYWLFFLSSLTAAIIISVEARLQGEGIVGGDDAKEGDFPYQISLQVYGKSICGGSIIGERYIVTAAHCVTNGKKKLVNYPLKVIAGITDLKARDGNKVIVNVVQLIIPKEYSLSSFYARTTGDIAVLKLDREIGLSFNPNLRKIDLPKKDETYAGFKAVISGFGWNKVDLVTDPSTGILTETNGRGYDKMRYADALVITHSDCQRYFSDPIKTKHICAALVQRDLKKPEGICSGDSGGPLVYENALIGVVSTSPLGCIENRQPAVYTRVSEYVDFINKATRGVIDSTMLSTNLRVGWI